MAIFEQQVSKKVLLDDTQTLTCNIENWHSINGHTEYVIRVQRGPLSNNSWRVSKRYNDFVKLHSGLQASGIPLPLPPKKIIGNMEPAFITERQQALQKYLNIILMNPILVSSLPARSFVDPANYCQPFSEVALQHVSLALRGEVGWEVVCPLPEIGWRLRKHYYHVRCKSLAKDELWANWVDFGPDKYLDDKDMQAVCKSLTQIQHPYIHSIELCMCTDVGGLVVRTSHKNGSLRDLVCGAKPRQSFMKKYGNPKGHKPLETSQIALYGRQILEALKFLHDKGLPYGHLHPGNVIVDEDRIKLVDIENGVFGVSSFYRPYFMQHRKINSLPTIDVYSFGHLLYEMTFGSPLHESIVDNFPGDCPALLRSVLESILSSEACKAGLPTVEGLLNHAFFASVVLSLKPTDKAHLKIPNTTKEHLKTIKTQIEERLKDEQKMVRSQKRLARVQEMMSSEEEKKKQRHKMRQDQKLAKQRQKTFEEKEKNEKERCDRERCDRERCDRERCDRERCDRERCDKERCDRERSDKERSDKERSDKERSDKERSDKERTDRERNDKERNEKMNGTINGANGNRSDSVNSSATTSIGTATPPSASGSSIPSPPASNGRSFGAVSNGQSGPPPPPPVAPPPPPMMNGSTGAIPRQGSKDRSALLGAICNFNKNSLRKTKAN